MLKFIQYEGMIQVVVHWYSKASYSITNQDDHCCMRSEFCTLIPVKPAKKQAGQSSCSTNFLVRKIPSLKDCDIILVESTYVVLMETHCSVM